MAQWTGKTKGSLFGYKIFLYFIKVFGVNTAYLLLRFVTPYYFYFAKGPRENLAKFYTVALKCSVRDANKLVKKNFYIFGQTLVDRCAFLLGKGKQITYTFNNESVLLEAAKNGKGAVLLSGHLGNWETSGNLLKNRISNKINVLMMDAEVAKIKEYLKASTGGPQFNIIPIKNDFSHIIRIKNALSDNEIVAIHADRYTEGSKYIEVMFFDRLVKFPYGPFLVASKFKVPVVFVYGVKGNKKHYELSAKSLAQGTSPEEIAESYVRDLEKMVRKYPEQWFNYYNYFDQI